MTPFWPTDIPQGILISYSGGTKDARASFDTLAGPVTRPRTTASIGVFSARPVPMSRAEFAAFEAWVNDDLRGGALAFCMRDPMTNEPRMWKIASGDDLYQFEMRSTDLVQVSMTLVRLPAVPWFAAYVPAGTSEVPNFVADYENDIYGVDGAKTPASAIENVAGINFDIVTDEVPITITLPDQSGPDLTWFQLSAVYSHTGVGTLTEIGVFDGDSTQDNWWIDGGVGFVDASTDPDGYTTTAAPEDVWFRALGDNTQHLFVRVKVAGEWSVWHRFQFTSGAGGAEAMTLEPVGYRNYPTTGFYAGILSGNIPSVVSGVRSIVGFQR